MAPDPGRKSPETSATPTASNSGLWFGLVALIVASVALYLVTKDRIWSRTQEEMIIGTWELFAGPGIGTKLTFMSQGGLEGTGRENGKYKYNYSTNKLEILYNKNPSSGKLEGQKEHETRWVATSWHAALVTTDELTLIDNEGKISKYRRVR